MKPEGRSPKAEGSSRFGFRISRVGFSVPSAAPSRPLDHRRQEPLAEFLRLALRRDWRQYRKYSQRCKKEFPPEAVHNLRVSTRRLHATIRLAGQLLQESEVRGARRALKKRLDLLSRLRDTHVQRLYVKELCDSFPVAKKYYDALHRRERHLVKRVSRRWRHGGARRLACHVSGFEQQLRALANDVASDRRTFGVVLDAVRAAFADVVARRREIQPSDIASIHRTRIAFKKFRYMVEALHPLLPGITRRELRAMHAYQTRMGNIQDIDVLLEDLDKYAAKKGHGAQWQKLHAELARQRTILIRKYLRSAAELDGFQPFPQALSLRMTNSA